MKRTSFYWVLVLKGLVGLRRTVQHHLCDPMDSIVHGILQARILEWLASSLLQGIFPTQGSNSGLPYCRRTLSKLSHQETQIITEMKCTVDVMHLIHPKMIPLHLNHGKIVFHETGPWYQKRLGATALEACYREVTNVVKQVTWIQIQTLRLFPVLPRKSHLIFPTSGPLVCKMQVLIVLSLMVWWGLNEIRGVKSLAQCPAHRKHSVTLAVMTVYTCLFTLNLHNNPMSWVLLSPIVDQI